MKRIAFLMVAVSAVAAVVAFTAPVSGHADEEAAPVFGIKIPPGYRDWKLISVAHEEGNLNDLRAVLGNDVAIKAYREGKLPFPDGTIIARLAWSYIPSRGKQQGLWPFAIFRGWVRHECSVYGQGLKKIRRDGRLGVCSIQRWQTSRRGAAQDLLPLSRACQSSRLCLYALRTLIPRTTAKRLTRSSFFYANCGAQPPHDLISSRRTFQTQVALARCSLPDSARLVPHLKCACSGHRPTTYDLRENTYRRLRLT